MFKRIKALGIIYLINDITSFLLKKDIDRTREQLDRLRAILIIVILLFAVSLVFNILFVLNMP